MTTILGGAGYTTAGDLMLQMILDSDEILALNGIGPKAMADIEKAIANLEFEEEIPEIEEPVAEEESQVVEDEEIVAEVELVAETEVIEEAEAIEVEAPVDEETIEVVQVGVEAEEGDLKTEEEEPKLVGIPELEEVKQDASLEEIFALRPDVLEYSGDDIDEEEEDDETDRKRKKRKKKKYIQAEYDPEQDVVLYTRKRKRGGGGEWDEDQWDV
jgi:ABC-type Fe3+-hydroxamate transport system substrate-binding protein